MHGTRHAQYAIAGGLGAIPRASTIAAAILLGASIIGSVRGQETEVQGPQEMAEYAGRDLIGSPPPPMVVDTIDGESIDLGALYGTKAVYLKFWATWCVPCRQQMPHFEHAHQTAGPDLAVIGVNIDFNDSLPDVRAVINEDGLSMPAVMDDGRLAAAFNLRVTPQHVVVGRDGVIQYIGHLADEKLDTALREAQAPLPPSGQERDASTPVIVRYAVGERLPNLSAVTVDGATFQVLDEGDSRPTVLVFTTTWCESYLETSRPAVATACRQVREQVDAMARTEPRVRWLGVVSGLWATEPQVRDYQARHEIRIPLMLDPWGEWFRWFEVTGAPTLLVVDSDGVLVERIEGFDAALEDKLVRALAF
jgi:thiol-disulfide isomerase/thioredoxin